MTLSTQIARTGRRALSVCACATLLIMACSRSSTTPQLRDARSAYDDAEDGPAATYARGDLRVARSALDRAERAHEQDPGSDREAQLAYLAERKAEIARAHGEMGAAERAKATARASAKREQQLAREASRQPRPVAAAKVDRDDDRDDKLELEATPYRRPAAARPTVERRPAADQEAFDSRAVAALQSLSQVANVKEEPRGVVITISGALLFPSGEERLSPIARQNLDQVANALAQQPSDRSIRVEGHTDDTGSERTNVQLSRKRARAVAEYLIERDIDAERIETVGYGESRPIADNGTAEGRSANRRIEIVIGAPAEPFAEADDS